MFYQIREAIKIIKIITQCKTVKLRKLKYIYFKIPNTYRDIDWFMIKKSPWDESLIFIYGYGLINIVYDLSMTQSL